MSELLQDKDHDRWEADQSPQWQAERTAPPKKLGTRIPTSLPHLSTVAKREQVLPFGLPIGAVEFGTEPTGFCDSNAAGTVGRAAILITRPGFPHF